MPFATDEEIRFAHDVLLKGKNPFDGQRVNIIKEDSSCYVQACPGSGKTTALLAKLIILGNRMPLEEGKGVCVLTHTNVAIDEIKAKLGQKADVLFKYPNFFGTIQTFLHKYVTAAALHYFYGSQIAYVDDDVAKAVLLKKYGKLGFENKLKKLVYTYTAAKEHIIGDDEINEWGGTDVLTTAKVIKRKGVRVVKYDFQLSGYDLTLIPGNIKSLIYAKKKQILDKEGKEIILSAKVDWPNNKVIINKRQIGVETEAGAEFVKTKEEIFKEGVLSFEDAYDLAFRYIWEKSLDFSNFSDKRFKYLFIDEVQDCDKQQVELIQRLFADNKVIVQRFGDYCQAIFEGEESDGTEIVELRGEHVLYIQNSNRFGELIAKPLRSLCMEDNSLLVGNDDVHSAKPVIICYEDSLTVLQKYVELLGSTIIPGMDNRSVLEIANKERMEDPLHRVNIKACGWVGKKGATEQKKYIESYFPGFERKKAKARTESEAFVDFLFQNPKSTVKEYATSIIQGILKFLNLCEVKNEDRRYTKTSLLDFLTAVDAEKKEDFLSKVMNWALSVTTRHSDEELSATKEAIYQYLTTILLPLFDKEATEEANNFFNANNGNDQDGPAGGCGNLYQVNGIEIEVATVHSVKGETHASTLYLETYYNRYHESERLADQFKGIAYTGTDGDSIKSLKVVYVGMSRPRYLLCVAIQKDRFDRIDCPELREIWDVVEA